jgi:GxxExxY protein
MQGTEHSELTQKILSCAFEVSNELGIGFLESVYENSLMIALQQQGLEVEQQVSLPVKFRDKPVGQFFIDLLVNGLIVLELKAAKAISPEHEMQLLNYLRASEKPIGLILNFGCPKLEYRRYRNRLVRHSEG